MTQEKIPIAVAQGDGIGPEIMGVVLQILKAVDAPLDVHHVTIGEAVYLQGHPTGINDETWEILRSTKAFLKAPITTPQGGGFKSLNVTVRTTLGLYANVRPCISYHPVIKTKHPNMDVVIIRENEEDLYIGVEYSQTPGIAHALKIITQEGCEKIIRYAFEYALKHGRKKVTCFTKDNILKMTDGLFHQVFEEISKEYPFIESEHWIIDIGAAKLADTPEHFDVIVLPNLYGDILSDVAAQIAGSVGLAGSANIGEHIAMFEAIHGSAPRRANQNLANPSGLILATVQMLHHIGLPKHAKIIHNGWLKTIEDGIHTYDIYDEDTSTRKVGTKEFGQAVIERLGKTATTFSPASYNSTQSTQKKLPHKKSPQKEKVLIGVDLFIESSNGLDSIRQDCISIADHLPLSTISNHGVQVWPEGHSETHLTQQWQCRFLSKDPITPQEIPSLLQRAVDNNISITQMQLLYMIDGKYAFSNAPK